MQGTTEQGDEDAEPRRELCRAAALALGGSPGPKAVRTELDAHGPSGPGPSAVPRETEAGGSAKIPTRVQQEKNSDGTVH